MKREQADRALSILIYHRVLGGADPLMPELPTAPAFERHMRWLRRFFRVLPLETSVEQLRTGTLPPRSVAITFDDGYADNHEVALPILRRLGLPATFFIATAFLDGSRMWNDTVIESVRRWPSDTLTFEPLEVGDVSLRSDADRMRAIGLLIGALKRRPLAERQALADALHDRVGVALPAPMMTSGQVLELHRSGMTIGAHTRRHPILSVLPPSEAHEEIRGGKQDLEDLIDAPVRLFAYPNGRPDSDYTPLNVRQVRELGFTAAVSTAWGVATAESDPFQLPRFTPWDRQTGRFVLRLALHRWRSVGQREAVAVAGEAS